MAIDVTSGFPIFSQNLQQAAYAFITNRREYLGTPVCVMCKYPGFYYSSKSKDVYVCEMSRIQKDYSVQFDLILENPNYNSYDLALQVNEPMRYNIFLQPNTNSGLEYKLLMNGVIPVEFPTDIYTNFGNFKYGVIILNPDSTLPPTFGGYTGTQMLQQTKRLLLENIGLPFE